MRSDVTVPFATVGQAMHARPIVGVCVRWDLPVDTQPAHRQCVANVREVGEGGVAVRFAAEGAGGEDGDHRNHPRKLRPFAMRTEMRPRELTVTRPTRRDADTPDLDRFNQLSRPVWTRFRKMNPMAVRRP